MEYLLSMTFILLILASFCPGEQGDPKDEFLIVFYRCLLSERGFQEETVYVSFEKSKGVFEVVDSFGSECMVQNFSQIRRTFACMDTAVTKNLPEKFALIIDFVPIRKPLDKNDSEERIAQFKSRFEIQDVYEITYISWFPPSHHPGIPLPEPEPILELPKVPIEELGNKN